MITPSTSSTLTADATPAPSARPRDRSIWIASLSPCSSARAQMPLVRRVRSCSFISLNRSVLRPFLDAAGARAASIAARPAYASMQPRRPHVQRAPSISTTMCPISPAPPRPVHGLPSRIRPPPTPVPQNTPEQRAVRPPGAQFELGVGRHLHVVADPHPGSRARLRASRASGNVPSQPGRLRALVTVAVVDRARASRRPTPASDAGLELGAPWRRRATRPPSPRRRPPGPPLVGVGRRAEPSTLLSSSTITAWILVPPRSIPP